jgi:hypothetical protein
MGEVAAPPPVVALDEAIAAGVPPTWTEAVALTRAICAGLEPPYLMPTLAQIFVLPTGHVTLTGTRHDPRGPVAGVGHLMQHLVDQSSAPAQLLEIQKQALAPTSSYASLQEFHEALSFFARPDAQGELAGYYNRAARVLENVVRDEAFDELKEKARAEEPTPDKPGAPSKWRRRAALAAATGIVALASVLAWWYYGAVSVWLRGPARTVAGSAVTSVSVVASKATAVARSAVAQLLGDAPAPEAPASTTPPERPTSRSGRARQAAPDLPARASGHSTAVAPPRPANEHRVVLSEVPAPLAETATEPVPLLQAFIYSAADPDVHAPTLLRPQLPKKRPEGLPKDEAGSLELLVLENGTVEEARLIPASNRLQDRLLISASKAWQFRPAEKNGRPVRYRILVPITW